MGAVAPMVAQRSHSQDIGRGRAINPSLHLFAP
jgi:hypothetical protein